MPQSSPAFPEHPDTDQSLPQRSRCFRLETQDLAFVKERIEHESSPVLFLETATLRSKLWASFSDVFWSLLIYLTIAFVPFLLIAYLFRLKHPAFALVWLAIALVVAGRWMFKQATWSDVRFGPDRCWRILRFDPLRVDEGRMVYSWRGRPQKSEASIPLRNCSVFAGCTENSDHRYLVVGIADDAALDEGFPDAYLCLFEQRVPGYGDLTDAEEARLRTLAEVVCRRGGLRYRPIRTAQSR